MGPGHQENSIPAFHVTQPYCDNALGTQSLYSELNDFSFIGSEVSYAHRTDKRRQGICAGPLQRSDKEASGLSEAPAHPIFSLLHGEARHLRCPTQGNDQSGSHCRAEQEISKFADKEKGGRIRITALSAFI